MNAVALLVEIIDLGSLSAAARQNKTSRSAVSQKLKALEASLGLQLLRRTTRQIEPTDVGRRLYEHGRNIVTELRLARAEASTSGVRPRGLVRLSIPTGLGEAVIAQLLLEFKTLYPEVMLEVLFENRIFDLLGDKIDIAVRILSSPPESLHALDLGPVNWLMCATPAYLRRAGRPTTLAELPQREILCATAVGKKLVLSAARAGEQKQVVLDPVLRSENFRFLEQAALAGLGLGLLPFYQVEDEIARGLLVPVLTEYRFSLFGRKAMLLAMPDRFRPAASSSLIEFLKLRIRAELSALERRFVAARLAPCDGRK